MLAEGTPDDGAEDVADEVDGDGEDELLLDSDVEVGGDEGDGHGGEGGAHC